jgi:hypothetical protein
VAFYLVGFRQIEVFVAHSNLAPARTLRDTQIGAEGTGTISAALYLKAAMPAASERCREAFASRSSFAPLPIALNSAAAVATPCQPA